VIILAVYRDLNALYRYLQRQLNNVMEKDVAEEVKRVMEVHIQTDVYNAYEPTDYVRTYKLMEDVQSELIDDGTIEVKDTRSENGRDITRIIEDGIGYDWGYQRNLDQEIGARPFIANTRNDLDTNKSHIEVLKKALQDKGFRVE
jgi:hypothetical protein